MNKKGFTLVEMLVVVSLLAVLASIVIPLVLNVNNSANKRSFETKKNLIVNAAEMYVHENHYSLSSSTNISTSKNYYCVSVEEILTSTYLETDLNNGQKNCTSINGCVTNPVDDSILNSKVIKVEVKNGNYIGSWDNNC
jgi:prepilin-type N-terminal cleavage/methylation domain-containing protein